MIISGKELIDAIEKVCVLEWYSYRKYPTISSELKMAAPPAIVWRYDDKSTSHEQIDLITRVVQETIDQHKGKIAWAFGKVGRNWVLHTKRVADLEQSSTFKKEIEIQDHIALTAPQFGINAFNDLSLIINGIISKLSL